MAAFALVASTLLVFVLRNGPDFIVGAEAVHGLARRILYSEIEVRVPGDKGHEPTQVDARLAQVVGSEETRRDDGLVDPRPVVDVLLIPAPKVGEEPAGLETEAVTVNSKRQLLAGGETFFELKIRFSFGVDRERERRFCVEVRIDGTADQEFEILKRETTHVGIMPASLKLLQAFPTLGRPAAGSGEVQRDIDQP